MAASSVPRWRTPTIALVVIGATAGLAASCSPDPSSTYIRNGYATREDCLRDYPPDQCRTERVGSGFGFVGPWYLRDRSRVAMGGADPGPGATAVDGRSQSATTQTTRRSGFGSTAASRGYHGG